MLNRRNPTWIYYNEALLFLPLKSTFYLNTSQFSLYMDGIPKADLKQLAAVLQGLYLILLYNIVMCI